MRSAEQCLRHTATFRLASCLPDCTPQSARLDGVSGPGGGGHIAGASTITALKTPQAPRVRSAYPAAGGGGGGGAGHLPVTTPSMAAMKSAQITTPARFNPLLPKTPAGGMARRPRRGEVLYAVSANGSPILA